MYVLYGCSRGGGAVCTPGEIWNSRQLVYSSCDHSCSQFDCRAGSYKAYGGCHECNHPTCFPGSYRETCPEKSLRDATCVACDAGKYSDTGNVTSCTSCPAGKYSSSNASSCQDCPDDSFSTASNITLIFGSAYPSTCACNVGYFGLVSSAISQTGFLGQWYEYSAEMTSREFVGFGGLTPLLTTTDPHINFGSRSAFPWPQETPYAVRWTGHVLITSPGEYTFETDSDDGSWIWINEVLTVDNGGSHGMQKRSGTAVLSEGYHNFRLHYYNGGGGAGLIVRYHAPDASGEWILLKGLSAMVMECAICPAGTYVDSSGATTCILCPANSTTGSTGATMMTDCNCRPGYEGPPAGPCTPCEAGKFSADLVGDCIPCGFGNYSFSGSSSCFSLEIAIAGTWVYLASSAGSGASQSVSITKGITRTSGIEQTDQWASSVEHSAATTFGHMYTQETSTEQTTTVKASAGFGGFGGSVEHSTTHRDTNSESTMQTTNSGIAEQISEEHASSIAQMIEENTEVEITQGFGNSGASGAGVLWQFQYKIVHLWGDNTVGTENTALTDNLAERPCCLPGTFRDVTKSHGPCLANYPCICRPWVCTVCPAGKYKVEIDGDVSCAQCEAGTYLTTEGSDDASDCEYCAAGKFSTVVGATAIDTCENCGAGKYKALAGANTACDECEAGKYKAVAGVNTACDACEAGKHKSTSGVNIACDNCEAGKYKADAGVNTACDDCEAGKYSEVDGATSQSDCLACEEGKTSAAGSDGASDCSFECAAGWTGRPGSCTRCSPGTFKAEPGEGPCLTCPAYSHSSRAGESSCQCNAGFTGPGIDCSYCAAGKFKTTFGSAPCDSCEAGKYSQEVGADTNLCQECEAGKYQVSGAATACDSCEAGKYKDTSGVNTVCDDCEAGKFKANAGVNLACDNCKTGTYKAAAGVNTACDDCDAGKFQASAGALECTSCPQDTWSAAVGASSDASCTPCPDDTVSGFGSDEASDCKNLCPAGKFSQMVGSDTSVCQECKAGKFNAASGVNPRVMTVRPASSRQSRVSTPHVMTVSRASSRQRRVSTPRVMTVSRASSRQRRVSTPHVMTARPASSMQRRVSTLRVMTARPASSRQRRVSTPHAMTVVRASTRRRRVLENVQTVPEIQCLLQ